MPSDENKTQDISQQNPVSAEPVIVEKIPPVEQVKPEPIPEISPAASTQADPIQEIPQPSSVEAMSDKQPQITPQGRTSPVAPLRSAPPRGTTFSRDFIQKLLIKARAKIQERKQKKLDKIMILFEVSPQITNKDIQKLLRVSSATATRYLDILESENRIKQVGSTGKSVFYTKI